MFNVSIHCKNAKSIWHDYCQLTLKIQFANDKQSNFVCTNLRTKKWNFFEISRTSFERSSFWHITIDIVNYMSIWIHSRSWEYVDMIYHVESDSNDDFSRIKIQFIMFLNKCFIDVEKNYWSTKLKIVDIIWIIRKIRHMIENNECSSTIIYIHHFVAILISRQINFITSNIDKFNLRFIRASQYLSKFNLSIKHKSNKFNIMFDVLSRLQIDTNVSINEKVDVLETLYDSSIEFCDEDRVTIKSLMLNQSIYHIILMKMTDEFKNRFKRTYQNDFQWNKILFMIKFVDEFDIIDTKMTSNFFSNQSENIIDDTSIINIIVIEKNFNIRSELRFKYRQKFVYYMFDDERERLCVSTFMKQKMFQLTHDQIHHDDFHKIYDRIASFVYIRQLSQRLRNYIAHCSKCQLNQIKRHSIYDELTFIVSSIISFHIIIMNWIIKLFVTKNEYNILFFVICKFIKRILLIVDKNIWNTTTWIDVIIIVFVNHDWNMSRTIINDKNIKFMFDFWFVIATKMNITMLTFTIYHSQTNEQFERINQIIEITFRFHIIAHSLDDWTNVFSYLQTKSNNVKQFIIDYASNELMYDFKINDFVNMLIDFSSKNYNKLKQIKREDVEFVMTFINVVNKKRYDNKHKTLNDNFKFEFMMYLRFHQNYIIIDLSNKKLFNQRIDSFKIIETIDKFKQTWRLKLFFIMKIHSIIFITQLESITFDSNFYDKNIDKDFSSIEEEHFIALTTQTSHYEIERLINKRVIRNQSYYLIKWKNYDNEHNVWYFLRALNNVNELIDEYEARTTSSQIDMNDAFASTRNNTRRDATKRQSIITIQFVKQKEKIMRNDKIVRNKERDRFKERDKFRDRRTK